MNAYVLLQKSYGDFDIAIFVPVAVSEDKQKLLDEADRLNNARSESDIEKGIMYLIFDKAVRLI